MSAQPSQTPPDTSPSKEIVCRTMHPASVSLVNSKPRNLVIPLPGGTQNQYFVTSIDFLKEQSPTLYRSVSITELLALSDGSEGSRTVYSVVQLLGRRVDISGNILIGIHALAGEFRGLGCVPLNEHREWIDWRAELLAFYISAEKLLAPWAGSWFGSYKNRDRRAPTRDDSHDFPFLFQVLRQLGESISLEFILASVEVTPSSWFLRWGDDSLFDFFRGKAESMAAIVSSGLHDVQNRLDRFEVELMRNGIFSWKTDEEDTFGDCTSHTRTIAFYSMRKQQKLDSPLCTPDLTFGEIRERVAEVVKGCEHGCGKCPCNLMPNLRELCEQVGKVIENVGQRLIDDFEAYNTGGKSMILI